MKKLGYRQGLLVAAAAVLLCVGLWTSWRYTIGVWRSDPDIFVTVQLWKGVREFGPGFIRTWIYTQDNWLFSLIPFTALFYDATLKTAVLPGWLIFVGSVVLTAALIWRLAGGAGDGLRADLGRIARARRRRLPVLSDQPEPLDGLGAAHAGAGARRRAAAG